MLRDWPKLSRNALVPLEQGWKSDLLDLPIWAFQPCYGQLHLWSNILTISFDLMSLRYTSSTTSWQALMDPLSITASVPTVLGWVGFRVLFTFFGAIQLIWTGFFFLVCFAAFPMSVRLQCRRKAILISILTKKDVFQNVLSGLEKLCGTCLIAIQIFFQ